MNNPLLIEKSWRSFVEATGLDDAPDVQKTEMRRAFYAGATTLFYILNKVMDPSTVEPTEMDLEIVTHISDEFAQFHVELEEGRA